MLPPRRYADCRLMTLIYFLITPLPLSLILRRHAAIFADDFFFSDGAMPMPRLRLRFLRCHFMIRFRLLSERRCCRFDAAFHCHGYFLFAAAAFADAAIRCR